MAFIQSQLKSKGSLIDKLEFVVRTITVNYKRHRLYTRTVSELNALSVRELSDLGLSKSVIRSVAYAAVYGGNDVRENHR